MASNQHDGRIDLDLPKLESGLVKRNRPMPQEEEYAVKDEVKELEELIMGTAVEESKREDKTFRHE